MNYKEIATVVRKHLDENGIRHVEREMDAAMSYRIPFGVGKKEEMSPDENKMFDKYEVVLVVRNETIQAYTLMPVNAIHRKPEVAEFLMRANCGLVYGGYEMDYDDGNVRFHETLPSSAVAGNPDELLPGLICRGVSMMKRYAFGYMKVVMGDMTPEAAINEIEK